MGFVLIYTTGHFLAIQQKGYSERTKYEKVVTWIGIASIVLIYLSVITE